MPSRHIMSAALGTGKSPLSIVHYIRNAYPQPLLILAPASKVRCFVADTMVATPLGNIPIQDIEVGDFVYTYNGKNIVTRKVARTFKNSTSDKMLYTQYNGSYIISTDDHKVLSNNNYKMAKELTTKDYLYGDSQYITSKNTEVFGDKATMCNLSKLSNTNPQQYRATDGNETPVLYTKNLSKDWSKPEYDKNQASEFYKRLSNYKLSLLPKYRKNFNEIPEACDTARKAGLLLEDMPIQRGRRDKQEEELRKSNRNSEKKTSSIHTKRDTYFTTTKRALRKVRDKLANGVCITVTKRNEEEASIFHSRYSQPQNETMGRNRRQTPQREILQNVRQRKRQGLESFRVESVSPAKRLNSSAGTEVFCIEVEDYHNFIANGVVVHNCGDWERELEEVFIAHNLALPEYEILSYDKFAYNPTNKAFMAGKRAKWHEFAPHYGGRQWAVIADECLTGETKVDTDKGLVEIADIKIGDKVMSYNHKAKKTEYKTVTRLIKRKSDDVFYKVNYANGAIISTYNHPHFVNGEYKLAKDIRVGDILYEQQTLDDSRSSSKKICNQNDETRGKIWQKSVVQLLQKDSACSKYGRKTGTETSSKKRKELVLFGRLWQNIKPHKNEEAWQATSQDNQQSRVSSQSTSHTQTKRYGQAYMGERQNQDTSQGGQWQGIKTATNVIRQTAKRLGTRIAHKNTRNKGFKLSPILQSRHRQSTVDASNRGRWGESQFKTSQISRSKENQKIKPVRVESVEILERADIERLGYVRNPNYVYCLEVQDNNNFFANGILTHNCHYIKQPTSNRSKATYWATKDASFFIGLSGTPLANGWIDFAGYSKIFGFTKGITEFKKKYCNIQTYKGFPEIIGYWREGELTKQWQAISKPLSRENATELPQRSFYTIKFKRPAKYIKYILDRKNDAGEHLDNPSLLAHSLRQVLAPEKIDYLSDLLASTQDNIVVFYNYNSELALIKDMLKKKHKDKIVFEQNGQKHQIPTKEQWGKVQNSVTLAHYKSGSTGVEMQYANITIYFSPTYSYQEYEQSKGRVWRNGQEKKCIFYIFKTQNTIETDVWDCLRQKRDFSASLWSADE